MSNNASAVTSRSFNPADINTFQLYNKDYDSLPVKIRLEGGDPNVITLAPGSSLSFAILYSGGKAAMFYNNNKLQMIDLNDGGRSDDFLAPNEKDNDQNTLRYDAGRPQGGLDTIDFNSNTYVVQFEDRDGVDGGTKAVFDQSISGSAIKCSISLGRRP